MGGLGLGTQTGSSAALCAQHFYVAEAYLHMLVQVAASALWTWDQGISFALCEWCPAEACAWLGQSQPATCLDPEASPQEWWPFPKGFGSEGFGSQAHPWRKPRQGSAQASIAGSIAELFPGIPASAPGGRELSPSPQLPCEELRELGEEASGPRWIGIL